MDRRRKFPIYVQRIEYQFHLDNFDQMKIGNQNLFDLVLLAQTMNGIHEIFMKNCIICCSWDIGLLGRSFCLIEHLSVK